MKTIQVTICILLFLTVQACGVAIHSDGHDSGADFVSYKIYELYPNGNMEYIYSDCFNIDDPFDSSGSVHVDTRFSNEDLVMKWDRRGSSLVFTFSDNYHYLESYQVPTYVFRYGDMEQFEVESGFTTYFISLEGPFCTF